MCLDSNQKLPASRDPHVYPIYLSLDEKKETSLLINAILMLRAFYKALWNRDVVPGACGQQHPS